MDELVVVTYPQPLPIEARPVDHMEAPEGTVGLAYYFRGHLIARGVISEEAVDAVRKLLKNPIPVALAASEDEDGNIDGRVCLVLPVKGQGREDEDEGPDEPWKASVPVPPWEAEGKAGPGGTPAAEEEEEEEEDGKAHVALLPIGNVVRNASDRHHPDVVGDAREMLENLLSGQARDAVQKAIDDLLGSL